MCRPFLAPCLTADLAPPSSKPYTPKPRPQTLSPKPHTLNARRGKQGGNSSYDMVAASEGSHTGRHVSSLGGSGGVIRKRIILASGVGQGSTSTRLHSSFGGPQTPLESTSEERPPSPSQGSSHSPVARSPPRSPTTRSPHLRPASPYVRAGSPALQPAQQGRDSPRRGVLKLSPQLGARGSLVLSQGGRKPALSVTIDVPLLGASEQGDNSRVASSSALLVRGEDNQGSDHESMFYGLGGASFTSDLGALISPIDDAATSPSDAWGHLVPPSSLHDQHHLDGGLFSSPVRASGEGDAGSAHRPSSLARLAGMPPSLPKTPLPRGVELCVCYSMGREGDTEFRNGWYEGPERNSITFQVGRVASITPSIARRAGTAFVSAMTVTPREAIPPGMVFNEATGEISGTPLEVSSLPFSLLWLKLRSAPVPRLFQNLRQPKHNSAPAFPSARAPQFLTTLATYQTVHDSVPGSPGRSTPRVPHNLHPRRRLRTPPRPHTGPHQRRRTDNKARIPREAHDLARWCSHGDHPAAGQFLGPLERAGLLVCL